MKTNHPDFDELTQKKNREAKTYPVSHHVMWCNCDTNHVRTNEKCQVCGFKFKTKHRKK